MDVLAADADRTDGLGGRPAEPRTAPEVGALVEADGRRIAAATWAGLVAGFLVLGWGSRLAMLLLARLNPSATGRVSDDGFVIGQFDLGNTMGLVLFLTIVGLFGGLLALAVRQLRFGPVWFRRTSMTLGPGVVGGNLLVHTDGIDFRILEPTWLAILLFVLVPGLYALATVALVDRFTSPEGWFLTGPRWRVAAAAPLLVGVLVLPIVAVGMVVHVTWQRSARFRARASAAGLRNAARVILTMAFLGASIDLARKATELL